MTTEQVSGPSEQKGEAGKSGVVQSAEDKTFDIVYDGFAKRMKQKGYMTWPSKEQMWEWEVYAQEILDGLEKQSGH